MIEIDIDASFAPGNMVGSILTESHFYFIAIIY